MFKIHYKRLFFYNKLILKVILFTCFFALTACNNQKNYLQGYIEGRYTYITAQISGNLDQLLVERGTTVKQGQLLFVLDQEPEISQLAAAQKKIAQTESTLHDMQKGGRSTIIMSLEAQLEKAQADSDLMQKTLYRYSNMVKVGATAKADYDTAYTNYQTSLKAIKQMQANLNEAKLGARENAIKAQEAVVATAQAELRQVNWALEQKTRRAPIDAIVFDTFFQIGETVNAAQPVISLLAPYNIKVILFVPERLLSRISLGQNIYFYSDDCPEKYSAIISFISPEPEYTPPVIYSETSRDKLVYRVEAKLDKKTALFFHPGQPVRVLINSNAK